LDYQVILLLVAAGIVGGAINAIAGGATLFTFPAMMATGLPPIVANASNALALAFGNGMGAWTEKAQLPPRDGRFMTLLAVAAIGGIAGALLLLATPEKTFTQIVPLLIGGATLIFAFSKHILAWLTARYQNGGDHQTLRNLLVAPASIYGGYFGAGLSVVLMAIFSATSNWELRPANAIKNTLSTMANFSAAAIFIWQGVISWPETLILLAAAFAGGIIGGKLMKILPKEVLRVIIIGMGCIMTCVYAWRYWL
jgi:uncharacterized protein